MSKKTKFNVLDFVIVLVSILSILFVVFWKDIRVKFLYEEKNIQYTFEASGITEEELSSLKIGDKLIFSEDSNSAGTITSIESEKEVLSITLIDGTQKSYEADTYTIKCKASASGIKKEHGFYIDNKYFIVPGKAFHVETPKLSMEIQITELIMNWVCFSLIIIF